MKSVRNGRMSDELLDAARAGIAEVVEPRGAVAVLTREELETTFEVCAGHVVNVFCPADVHSGTNRWRNHGDSEPGRCERRDADQRDGRDLTVIAASRSVKSCHLLSHDKSPGAGHCHQVLAGGPPPLQGAVK